MMRALFPHHSFDSVETPLSFASRLASMHTGGRLVPFLHDIGVDPMKLAGGEKPAIEQLCAKAGVEAAPVLANAAQRIGKRRYELRGSTVTAEFLSNPSTAFCPACLQADDVISGGQPGARRGRWWWSMAVVRTCPVHGLPLVCLPKKAWDDQFHELAIRVPERDATLQALIDASAVRSVSPLQTYIVNRLDGVEGPSWLDQQTLDQAMRATEMLGVLTEFGPATNLQALSSDQWDQAGRAGFEFTSKGEAGIRDALEHVRRSFKYAGSKPGAQKIYGRLYLWAGNSKTGKHPGDIRRILREHIFDTIELPADKEVLGVPLERRRLHTVASLASESGLHPTTLRHVLSAQGLLPREEQGNAHFAFDADEGRRVAASVQRKVHVISLPKVLNCTRPQSDQLLSERILPPLIENEFEARGRTRKTVDLERVQAFLRGIESSAKAVSQAPAGYVPISKAAEKACASSVEIVHLILGGFTKQVAKLSNMSGLAGILVDPDEIRHLAAECLVGLSPSNAFARLRIPNAAGWALIENRFAGAVLPSVSVVGPNGAHRFWRVLENDIDAFATAFTTVVRIADDLKVEHSEVWSRLNRARVQPLFRKGQLGVELFRTNDLPASCRA